MERTEILSLVKAQLDAGVITPQDLAALQGSVPAVQTPAPVHESSRNLINVFYGIGAIIALSGVGVLVAQNWEVIGFAGRVLVSLGLSIVCYVAAMVFRKPEQRVISQVFFTISAALAPLGIFVVLNEYKIQITENTYWQVGLALTAVFGAALAVTRRNILVLLTCIFFVITYYAAIFALLIKHFSADELFVMKIATVVIGLFLLSVGYGYRTLQDQDITPELRERNSIRSLLYFFGTLAFLGACGAFGGIFDVIFIAVIFASFYASVFLRSRGVLILSALYLMGHIVKLTAKYFVNSVGWPVALIVTGFLIIGVGYGTFYLNKKYLSKKASTPAV